MQPGIIIEMITFIILATLSIVIIIKTTNAIWRKYSYENEDNKAPKRYYIRQKKAQFSNFYINDKLSFGTYFAYIDAGDVSFRFKDENGDFFKNTTDNAICFNFQAVGDNGKIIDIGMPHIKPGSLDIGFYGLGDNEFIKTLKNNKKLRITISTFENCTPNLKFEFTVCRANFIKVWNSVMNERNKNGTWL